MLALLATLWPAGARPALAWDSMTHRAIARLAIAALPRSPLEAALTRNEYALEQHAVEPDTVLKERFGKNEGRKHYLDIELLGADPWTRLDPNFDRMEDRFGYSLLEQSGTLPWTIESVSADLEKAWRSGDCEAMVRLSGYLAHYVGDASQPLHSTYYYDGAPQDHGIHMRIEAAVDRSLSELEPMAANEVRVEDLNDVWAPTIAEIHDAHGLISELTRDDRGARDAAGSDKRDYQRALMQEDAAMFAHQIARAASTAASIWLFEWHRAGSPAACTR